MRGAVGVLCIVLSVAASFREGLAADDCQQCRQPILATSTCGGLCPDGQDIQWRWGEPEQVCGNLTLALRAAQACIQQCGTPVRIELGGGNFHAVPTNLTQFVNASHITIASRQPSTICCVENSGFTFTNCSAITIDNVAFDSCGILQNSTSINTTKYSQGEGYILSYLEFRVAVYILGCGQVNLKSVNVTNSPGMGVVMYNTDGENRFEDCLFQNNGAKEKGGGGVAIEFTYCHPGDTECDKKPSNITNKNSKYVFLRCTFESNRALPSHVSYFTAYPHGMYHHAFDVGGGLYLSFKGKTINNSIILKECQFCTNFALWGSGLYLSFADTSENNSVLVDHSWFHMNVPLSPNMCRDVASPSNFTAGGGVRIMFVQYPYEVSPGDQPRITGNAVNFSNTTFSLNEACWGGGLSLSAARELPDHLLPTNTLVFRNCTFDSNIASMAAAADLSVFHPDTETGSLIEPVFQDCTFIGNKNNNVGQIATLENRMGVVYVNKLATTFVGETQFLENEGTALVIAQTGVHVTNYSVMVFNSNTGRRGGALGFIGNGWLMAHYSINLTFQNNSALQKGGAIYAVHFGEHDLMYQESCFFRYYDVMVHPKNWVAYFTFINNTVPGGEGCDIYTTSTFPCVWPSPDSTKDLIQEVFHWNDTTWTYNPHSSCNIQVSTAPSSFNNMTNEFFHVSAYPGQSFRLPLSTSNDYSTPLSQAVYAVSVNPRYENKAVVPSSTYYTTGELSVSGVPNTTSQLTVETLDPRVISTRLKVHLRLCPPGFVAEYNSSLATDCKCGYPELFICDKERYTASVLVGTCVTAQDNVTLFGRCPYSTVSALPENTTALEEASCGPMHRAGKLCGQCQPGYGVAVSSYTFSCEDCKGYQYKWVAYIAAELLPITLFFIVVAALHISVTSAPMNAFVFFSQVSAIPYFRISYPWSFGLLKKERYLQELFLVPYGIWNLDFFKSFNHGFCLSPHLSTLHALALGYVAAFYPLALLFVCYIVIKLYDRFTLVKRIFSCPVRVIRKIRDVWDPKTSMINVFSTFLLLSYCKLTFVSFSLLTPTTMYYMYDNGTKLSSQVFYYDASMEFFKGHHLIFVLVALVVLATFVVAPPVFLMLYPLKVFQRCLGTCPFRTQAIHTFADAFQGCFRHRSSGSWDCRYFAAIYFILRIVLFALYVSESDALQYMVQQVLCTMMIVLFLAVQPYKNNFYNYLDAAVFTLLATLNILSFYNYHKFPKISNPVFGINYALLFLPLLYLVLYVLYLCLYQTKAGQKCLRRCRSRWGAIRGKYESIDEDSVYARFGPKPHVGDDNVPDRLVNPQDYPGSSTNLWYTGSSGSSGVRNYGSLAYTDTGSGADQTKEFQNLT